MIDIKLEMSNKDNSDSNYIEYFKIIQNTISRFAQNSFLIKAWTITIIAGISVFTFSFITSLIFTVLIGVIVIFWVLDSYYLRLERLYRFLYEDVVNAFNDPSRKTQIKLFNMKYETFKQKIPSFLRTMISKSEGLFYITLILAMCFLIILNLLL